MIWELHDYQLIWCNISLLIKMETECHYMLYRLILMDSRHFL